MKKLQIITCEDEKDVKVIIAGGRDYILKEKDFALLDKIFLEQWRVSEIVSGGARGADKGGEQYAKSRGIPVKVFPADWDSYGKAAGFMRNEQMGDYADAVILFPGGNGTRHMEKTARKNGLKICKISRTKKEGRSPLINK